MLFSVIIPVYNVEKFLRESVDSILKQGEDDLEIILVDDGSKDSSGVICDEYQKKYPGIIRVIHKENEGLLLTRRCGLRAAKGDWFVHLDSDDYMLPGSLLAIRRAIEKYDVDLIICKIAYGAPDGESTAFYSRLPFANEQVFENEEKQLLYSQLTAGGYMTAICQKITRRDIVDIDTDYSKWERVSLAEDALQSLPILRNCKRAIFLNRPIIYYRNNGESITKQKSALSYRKNILSHLDVYLEESKYFLYWDLPKAVVNKACAKHCRTLCCQLKDMVLAAGQQNDAFLKETLQELKQHEAWDYLFTHADGQVLGRFSRICYHLVKQDRIKLLGLLCKRF